MSSAFDCCLPCPPGSIPSANTVNIPGPQGDPGAPGADGADGADGKDAFTTTLADVLLPVADNNVSVSCVDVSWMQVGQNVFMSGTEGIANFQVISRNTITNFAVLKFLAYEGDLASGLTISAGAGISPSGIQVQPVYPPDAFFVSRFESDQYAMTPNTQILYREHGLNGVPDILQARIVAQNNPQFDYVEGDEVDADSLMHIHTSSSDEEMGNVFVYGANNTHVWAGYMLGSNSINEPYMGGKTPPAGGIADLSDDTVWKFKLVAIKLTAP